MRIQFFYLILILNLLDFRKILPLIWELSSKLAKISEINFEKLKFKTKFTDFKWQSKASEIYKSEYKKVLQFSYEIHCNL